ncbi:MAG: PAS domain-containing protein [Hyphomicrobiaceae bacterium]
MRQKTSQTLFAYWNEVRAGRIAPRRLDIEPARIAEVLPDALILERVDFETYRFRLAGTRLCEHLGTDTRGRNLFDLFADEQDRITLERQCAAICKQGAVGVFTLIAEYRGGARASYEMVLHPLLHTSQTIDRLLGVMTPLADPSAQPPDPPEAWRLAGHALIWPDGRPFQIAGAMGATQSPFADHIRRARIVRSDRRQFRVYDGGLAKPRDDAP